MLEVPARAVAELQCPRINERGPALGEFNLAALAQFKQVLAQSIDDFLPMAAHAVNVNSRRTEVDAEPTGIARVGDELGGVQQRLGWDAADEQTRAARPL